MGALRICSYEDNHNPDIPRDELLDLAGVVYMQLREHNELGTFEEYYNKNFNHEYIYERRY